MNDIRRTILWVIFGFSMVLLWDQWQVFNGQKPTFFPSASQTAKVPAPATTASGSAAGAVPALPSTAGASGAAVSVVPSGAPSAAPASGAGARERVAVSTDVLKLTFDSEGGTLVRSEFTKYTDGSNKATGFVLLEESGNRVYVAQTGLIAGTALPTHKTPMTSWRTAMS